MRILRFIKAMIIFIRWGEIVDEYILKSRRELCEACPFKEGKRCSICTCYIKYKTRLSTESCPKNKW